VSDGSVPAATDDTTNTFGQSSVSVTFDNEFDTAPDVFATTDDSNGVGQIIVAASSISTTGCDIQLSNPYTSSQSGAAFWIAIA